MRLAGSKWFLRKGRGDYMFLVYEKNYNMDGDVDCVEGCDMKLFTNKEKALIDMKNRKEEYIDDNDFRYVKDESYEDSLCFKERNGDGYFYICMVELGVTA